MRGLYLLPLMIALAGTSALAADYHPPKNAYGAPDFDGMWSTASLTELERPDDLKTLVIGEADAAAFESKHRNKPPAFANDPVGGAESEWWERDVGLARIRGQIRTSWIVSPADGQIPNTPEAQAFYKARSAARKDRFDNPEDRSLGERCLDPGTPPMLNFGISDFFKVVQTRDQIALFSEYDHELRIVRMGQDARHPRADIRQWRGDSIGRWEGETLVIETTNFMPREVDDPKANPMSDMRLVERMTRISPDEMIYEFVLSNPSVQIQDLRGEMLVHTTKAAIYESTCHEGNYALEHILAGARQRDATVKP
jgi:hypothetical protein